jgi:serine phosphatase RsbU (regulator of sigma subunit)
VIRSGQSQLFEEIPDELLEQSAQDEEHLRLIRGVGVNSAITAPLVARGRTVGAFTLVTAQSGRRFDKQDLALAEEIGRRAGVAVDNARLFSERSHIARVLQESLLPQGLPEMPEADLAARFLPAGGGAEVGGDFYDLFKMPGAGWGLVMGDVCGKGADAAALTALARYTLRTAAMQAATPIAALESLNRAILERHGERRFCTAAFARLEPVDGKLRATIASGGHPMPLILRVDGTVIEAGGHGRLLGVDPDPQLKDQVVDLSPGDSLVLYTDGLTDAHAPARVLVEEDIERLLAGCAGDDAGEIAACLEHAALGDNGHTARDDIALMVLRAKSQG